MTHQLIRIAITHIIAIGIINIWLIVRKYRKPSNFRNAITMIALESISYPALFIIFFLRNSNRGLELVYNLSILGLVSTFILVTRIIELVSENNRMKRNNKTEGGTNV